LLVDDGSTDGSSELADGFATEHAEIRVVHHSHNQGYGAALTTGFRESRGSIVAYSDVDLPTPLQGFVDALSLLDDADVVIGYPSGGNKRLHRRLYSWGYQQLAEQLLGLEVRNVNFSFKLLRRSVVDQLDLKAETGFIDAQLLIQALQSGARLIEIAVPAQDRKYGESHFNSPLVAWRTGLELIRWKCSQK